MPLISVVVPIYNVADYLEACLDPAYRWLVIQEAPAILGRKRYQEIDEAYPLGLLIELASYRFEPPFGYAHSDVLLEAHRIRVERGDPNIAEIHLADALELLITRSRRSLSDARSPKDPY